MKKCGECNACCRPFPVPEVGKTDGMSLCRHASAGGCAIYATRPETCRLFECLWIARGDLKDSWRPDKLGVMFLEAGFEIEGEIVRVLSIWEVKPGASRIKSVRELARLNEEQRGMCIGRHTLNRDGTYNHVLNVPDGRLSKNQRIELIRQFKTFVGAT